MVVPTGYIVASPDEVSLVGITDRLFVPCLANTWVWLQPALWRYRMHSRHEDVWALISSQEWYEAPLTRRTMQPGNRYDLPGLANAMIEHERKTGPLMGGALWQITVTPPVSLTVAELRVPPGKDTSRYLEDRLGMIPIAQLSNERETRYTWSLQGEPVYTLVVVWDRERVTGKWFPFSFEPDPAYRPLSAPVVTPTLGGWCEDRVTVLEPGTTSRRRPAPVPQAAVKVTRTALPSFAGIDARKHLRFQEFVPHGQVIPGRERLYSARGVLSMLAINDALAAATSFPDGTNLTRIVYRFKPAGDGTHTCRVLFHCVVNDNVDPEAIARDVGGLVDDVINQLEARPLQPTDDWMFGVPYLPLLPVAKRTIDVSLVLDPVRRCVYPVALYMNVVHFNYPAADGPDWSALTRNLYRTQTGLPASNLGAWLYTSTSPTVAQNRVMPWEPTPRGTPMRTHVPLSIDDAPDFNAFMRDIVTHEFYQELYSADRSKGFKVNTPAADTFTQNLERNMAMLRALQPIVGLGDNLDQWRFYTRTCVRTTAAGFALGDTLQFVMGYYPFFVVRAADGSFSWFDMRTSTTMTNQAAVEASAGLVTVKRGELPAVVARLMEQDLNLTPTTGPHQPVLTINYNMRESKQVPIEHRNRGPSECEALRGSAQIIQLMCYGQRPTARLRACQLPIPGPAGVIMAKCIRVDGCLSHAIMLALIIESYKGKGGHVMLSGRDLELLIQDRLETLTGIGTEDRGMPHPVLSFLEPLVSLEDLDATERRFLSWFFLWNDMGIRLFVQQAGGACTTQYLKRPGNQDTADTRLEYAVLLVSEGALHVVHNPAVLSYNVVPDTVRFVFQDLGGNVRFRNELDTVSSMLARTTSWWIPLENEKMVNLPEKTPDTLLEGPDHAYVSRQFVIDTDERAWLVLKGGWRGTNHSMDASKLPITDQGAFRTNDGEVIIPSIIALEGDYERVLFYRQSPVTGSPAWTVCVIPHAADYRDAETHIVNMARLVAADQAHIEFGIATSKIRNVLTLLGFGINGVRLQVTGKVVAITKLPDGYAEIDKVPRINALFEFAYPTAAADLALEKAEAAIEAMLIKQEQQEQLALRRMETLELQ